MNWKFLAYFIGTVFLFMICMASYEAYGCNVEEKITEAVYFEARGESFHGKLAVATVIMERYHSGKFGETVCDVVNAKSQFSYYWDGVPEVMDDPKVLKESREIATCVVKGCTHAALRGAWDYYACKGMWKIKPPYWVKYYTLVAEIGNHCFFKRS